MLHQHIFPITNCFIAPIVLTFHDTVRYFTVSVLVNSLYLYFHLWQTLFSRTSCVFCFIGLACEVTRPQTPWLLVIEAHEECCLAGRGKKKILQARELLQRIVETADCVRGSEDIIREAINYLWDAQTCAYRKVYIPKVFFIKYVVTLNNLRQIILCNTWSDFSLDSDFETDSVCFKIVLRPRGTNPVQRRIFASCDRHYFRQIHIPKNRRLIKL